MYLAFYGLREFPFALSCDERFFYESSVHAEALANMIYTVQQRKGMVLVSGEVGAGKTFLCNMLGARLGASCETIVMQDPPQSGKQLIRAVAVRVGVNVASGADKMGLIDELRDRLGRLHNRGRLVALILDEAQDLTASALEELRLLWNWEASGQRLIQIILVGQPELRERLSEAKWEPLRQRIVLSYHLGPLSADDIASYINHRIEVAATDGCSAVFTDEAKAEVYAATTGIPRLVNVLCDNALLVGYARGMHLIDRPVIAEVIRDMTCWGLRVSEQGLSPHRVDVEPAAHGGQEKERA